MVAGQICNHSRSRKFTIEKVVADERLLSLVQQGAATLLPTVAPITPRSRTYFDIDCRTNRNRKGLNLAAVHLSPSGPELTSPDVRHRVRHRELTGRDSDIGFCPFMTHSGHRSVAISLRCRL